jgi:alpha-D-xyloside xylohydrolase
VKLISNDQDALADGVISLKATHWAGSAKVGPNFVLENTGTGESSVDEQEKSVTVKSGSLSASVNTEENKVKHHS